jgi:GNAT superfamily N-acetyltransferase
MACAFAQRKSGQCVAAQKALGEAMNLVVRPYKKGDYARVLEICIAAFEPIHKGFADALGSRIFDLQYHDWREQYAKTLRKISLSDKARRVHVAELEGAVCGFIFTFVDAKRRTGEIGLNAIDPAFQGRGIGKAIYAFALQDLKRRGAEVASVGTGGDAAHGPARSAYASVGFDKAIPGMYLFKVL